MSSSVLWSMATLGRRRRRSRWTEERAAFLSIRQPDLPEFAFPEGSLAGGSWARHGFRCNASLDGIHIGHGTPASFAAFGSMDLKAAPGRSGRRYRSP